MTSSKCDRGVTNSLCFCHTSRGGLGNTGHFVTLGHLLRLLASVYSVIICPVTPAYGCRLPPPCLVIVRVLCVNVSIPGTGEFIGFGEVSATSGSKNAGSYRDV